MKKLVYLMISAVFLGTQILALDIGVMKLSLYRISLILLLGMFLIYIVRNDARLKFYPNRTSFHFMFFYGVWLLYGIISVLWLENLAAWGKANFFIACGFISIFFIYQFIKSKADIWRVFQIIAGALLLHNLIGWMEILTGYYPFADLAKLDRYRTFATQPMTRIPISIYANQNDYATMLLAGAFITYILFKSTKNAYLKIGYMSLIVSTSYLIIRTDSRANILAALIGIVVLLVIKFRYLVTAKQAIAAVLIALAIGLVGMIVIPAGQEIGREILLIIFDTSNPDGSSNKTRLNLIRNGFVFLSNTFGLGVGAGNIEHWMAQRPVFDVSTKTNMHNWWMEILTGYGAGIFLAYLIIFFLMLRYLYHFYITDRDADIRHASFILIGYLSAFVLSSISSATNIIIEWQWLMFGVIIAFIGMVEAREEAAGKVKTNNRGMNLHTYLGGKNGEFNISKRT